jgi:hypothetical protein
MAAGRSLHIGLNRVDPAGYGGWDGQLTACEADAKDMALLADRQHFENRMLLTAEATSQAILAEIDAAAASLSSGDIFFLTYSGHGGQVPDTNGDEPEHYDETWVAYDRQIVDDELYARFGTFADGVRIAMLSDSCHSGSVAKAMFELGKPPAQHPEPGRIKALPANVRWPAYLAQKDTYDKIQDSTRPFHEADVVATVLLISGCQDDQTSADGDRNGLFTGTLLGVWKEGAFSGDYPDLAQATADRMPLEQQPNYLRVSKPNAEFEHEHPFTIEAGHAALV